MYKYIMLIIFIISLCPISVEAASLGGITRRGNKLYEKGEYDKAIEYYEKALNTFPNKPELIYNRASALYSNGSFDKARSGFLEASVFSDKRSEENSIYNAGNSEYRIAERAEEKSLEASLTGYKEALEHYKRAIMLDEGDIDAKYNYEITLKKISEVQKKKDEEEQKQEKKEDNQDKGENSESKENSGENAQDQKESNQQDKGENQKDQNNEEQKDKEELNSEEDKGSQKNSNDKTDSEEKEKAQSSEEGQIDKDEAKSDNRDENSEQELSLGKDQQEFNTDESSGELEEKTEGMTEEEAEMILKAQAEEENRMRDSKIKVQGKNDPKVLKNW